MQDMHHHNVTPNKKENSFKNNYRKSGPNFLTFVIMCQDINSARNYLCQLDI